MDDEQLVSPALDELRRLAEAEDTRRAAAEAALASAVAHARAEGRSWAQIGAAVKITGEGARRKWDRRK